MLHLLFVRIEKFNEDPEASKKMIEELNMDLFRGEYVTLLDQLYKSTLYSYVLVPNNFDQLN